MKSNIKNTETSPQVHARIGGIRYLTIIIAGIFCGMFVRGKLIVGGNATETALR